jgi:cytoskeletal protein RodZ
MGSAEAGRAQFVSNNGAEALSAASDPKPKSEAATLGTFLASARERRGVSLDDAVKETRIPNHYIRMLETNDYSLISDQLYVLPFLRRYAIFLTLDPEEIAMCFIREVQRADTTPAPRSLQPFEMDRAPRWNRRQLAIVTGLIGIIAVVWLTTSHLRSRHAEMSASAASSSENSASR